MKPFNHNFNQRIDWGKYETQEGLREPQDKYEAHSREVIKELSPELQAERIALINRQVRIMQIYDKYGTGIENYHIREQMLEEIKRGN